MTWEIDKFDKSTNNYDLLVNSKMLLAIMHAFIINKLHNYSM